MASPPRRPLLFPLPDCDHSPAPPPCPAAAEWPRIGAGIIARSSTLLTPMRSSGGGWQVTQRSIRTGRAPHTASGG